MKHYKGLTKAQEDTLSLIAFGGNGSFAHPKTLEVLKQKGLIVEGEKQIFGKGDSPIDRIPMTVKVYDMPLAEHIEFCQWCSEQINIRRVEMSIPIGVTPVLKGKEAERFLKKLEADLKKPVGLTPTPKLKDAIVLIRKQGQK